MVERTGPTLAIVGSCGGCPHLRPSTVGGHRLGFVDCAHTARPVPFIGNVNTSITTPADCPLLPAARLALARAIVAEADITGPARGVEGRACEQGGDRRRATCLCKMERSRGLAKLVADDPTYDEQYREWMRQNDPHGMSAPHGAQEESDQ